MTSSQVVLMWAPASSSPSLYSRCLSSISQSVSRSRSLLLLVRNGPRVEEVVVISVKSDVWSDMMMRDDDDEMMMTLNTVLQSRH